MSDSKNSPAASLFGLSFGWSYALAAFTLTVAGCLPLALIATMGHSGTGAERANALMAWLPIMAGGIAALSAVFYFTAVRQRPQWHRQVLLGMWALAALGIWGWWAL